jgi:hypothetical protein
LCIGDAKSQRFFAKRQDIFRKYFYPKRVRQVVFHEGSEQKAAGMFNANRRGCRIVQESGHALPSATQV